MFPPDRVEFNTYSQALVGLVDRRFIANQRYQEQQFRAARLGANPGILQFERRFVKRMRDLGVPFFAHCVVRSREEQALRKAEGVSKAGPGQSPHQYGCAVDLVHGTKAWGLTDKQWQAVGHIGRETAKSCGLKLVWGGDDPGEADKFSWDPAHWELDGWKGIREDYPWPK